MLFAKPTRDPSHAVQDDLFDACRAARRALAELNGRVGHDVWAALSETTERLDRAIAKARDARGGFGS